MSTGDSVWIVAEGENYEGHSPIGVFSSLDIARSYARYYMKTHPHHGMEWKEIEDNHWQVGCDNIYVYDLIINDPSLYE